MNIFFDLNDYMTKLKSSVIQTLINIKKCSLQKAIYVFEDAK